MRPAKRWKRRARQAEHVVELVQRFDAIGAIYARHNEFCISADNCKCVAEAVELEIALEPYGGAR